MKQNTPIWYKTRRKKITASRFGDIIAKPTTKRYKNYMDQIYNELIGVPDFEDDDKPWFQHGKDLESEAIGSYEFEYNIDVDRVFFEVHRTLEYVGASPDGYVGKDGVIEAKSRISLTEHLKTVGAGVDKKYIPQVQGVLWVSGRRWCDFISYYKSDNAHLLHVYRVLSDFDYHKMLEDKCIDFWNQIQERIKANGK